MNKTIVKIGGIITLIALFLMGIGFIGVSLLTGDSVEVIGPLILYGLLLLIFVGLPVLIGGANARSPEEIEKIKQINRGGEPDMTKNLRLLIITVERNQVEQQSDAGRQYITNTITNLARIWVREGRPIKADLTIGGYNNDPRELYEIPEVCQWAKWITNELPVLPYFLAYGSLDLIVFMLCGPVSKDAIPSKNFQNKFKDTRTACASKAVAESSEFFERIGFDQSAISRIYAQNIVDIRDNPVQQREGIWKRESQELKILDKNIDAQKDAQNKYNRLLRKKSK